MIKPVEPPKIPRADKPIGIASVQTHGRRNLIKLVSVPNEIPVEVGEPFSVDGLFDDLWTGDGDMIGVLDTIDHALYESDIEDDELKYIIIDKKLLENKTLTPESVDYIQKETKTRIKIE